MERERGSEGAERAEEPHRTRAPEIAAGGDEHRRGDVRDSKKIGGRNSFPLRSVAHPAAAPKRPRIPGREECVSTVVDAGKTARPQRARMQRGRGPPRLEDEKRDARRERRRTEFCTEGAPRLSRPPLPPRLDGWWIVPKGIPSRRRISESAVAATVRRGG
jgi:hypothetical protein